MSPLSRRQFLQYGGALGVAAATVPFWGFLTIRICRRHPTARRPPQTLQSARDGGDKLPFDHIVVVMMENHSFDNYLGALPRSGKARAQGLTFNRSGVAVNTNPGPGAMCSRSHSRLRPRVQM